MRGKKYEKGGKKRKMHHSNKQKRNKKKVEMQKINKWTIKNKQK